jgi:hypothetical protein
MHQRSQGREHVEHVSDRTRAQFAALHWSATPGSAAAAQRPGKAVRWLSCARRRWALTAPESTGEHRLRVGIVAEEVFWESGENIAQRLPCFSAEQHWRWFI